MMNYFALEHIAVPQTQNPISKNNSMQTFDDTLQSSPQDQMKKCTFDSPCDIQSFSMLEPIQVPVFPHFEQELTEHSTEEECFFDFSDLTIRACGSPVNNPLESLTPSGKFEMSELLAEGGQAQVWIGQNLGTEEAVAIKVLSLGLGKQEATILQTLKHDNIVQLLSYEYDEYDGYLILELLKDDLLLYLQDHGAMSEDDARHIFSQLISAVAYMHSQGIVHCDIKPENILLTSDLRPKLCDFGTSQFLSGPSECSALSTTYAAPELLQGLSRPTIASDMWSCGVLLYCMLTGYAPFSMASSACPDFEAWTRGECNLSFLSHDAQDLIQSLLQIDPSCRCSAEEAINHPWLS